MGAAVTGAVRDVAERARAFIHAIVWAEHTTLWDLLSGDGRAQEPAVNPPTRTAAVALSVEALLQQWARQSAAPAGAAVVADTEIAARRRGGVEWSTPDAVAVSVLARPVGLDPTSVDVAWAAASLATARALDECGQGQRSCLWPDLISCEPPDAVDVAITATCTLGPGRVELAVLTARVGPLASPAERTRTTDALLHHLRALAPDLDAPASILSSYRSRCSTLGQAVELHLLPHGTMRGLAEDIDDAGRLVLASPTGMHEQIPVAMFKSLRVLPG